jgi:hypothetical protein
VYKCWLHRLYKLLLDKNNKRKELHIIINIAINSGYRKEDIIKLYNQIRKQQNNKVDEIKANKKWVSFTYIGNYISKITKLFKNTNLKIAFRTNNAVEKLLGDNHTVNKYEKSGIYKMTCQSCQKFT